eukprot:10685189-Heterocapsa_arctica.AAC.1
MTIVLDHTRQGSRPTSTNKSVTWMQSGATCASHQLGAYAGYVGRCATSVSAVRIFTARLSAFVW